MNSPVWIMSAILAALLCALPSFAQTYRNASSVQDAAGSRTTAASFTNVCAIGQPGGVAVASGSGGMLNYAGFLNTFVMRAALDTDGDGLADEIDPDNDNDELADLTELAGDAFNPATTTDVNKGDSDGDGASDGAEAAAGTDPRSAAARFAIVSVAETAGGTVVGWMARSGTTYRVRHEDTGIGGFTGWLARVRAGGPAAAPWYATTNYYTDTTAPAGDRRYYRISVSP